MLRTFSFDAGQKLLYVPSAQQIRKKWSLLAGKRKNAEMTNLRGLFYLDGEYIEPFKRVKRSDV